MKIPRFFETAMNMPQPTLLDPVAEAGKAAARLCAGLAPGSTLAIGCGSRGIKGIDRILARVVAEAKAAGLHPYLVTAMGSHGGATAEGQLSVLSHYGVTEATMGAPIRAGLSTVCIGTTAQGIPVHWDKHALEADAVILVNRIKPHTTLRGNLGSGLSKMAVVGLGNETGAQTGHRAGLQDHLLEILSVIMRNTPLIGGIAIVENGVGGTAQVDALRKEEWASREPEMLAFARSLMPHIPIVPLDVLIVRKAGKNISGTGMDPNIIGMHRRHGGESEVEIKAIVLLDLDDHSQGNATGIGMADLITERLRRRIDWESTRINCFTGGFLGGLKLPFAMPDARSAIETAISLHGKGNARCAVIESTLDLSRLWLSENLRAEAESSTVAIPIGDACALHFDLEGNLAQRPLEPCGILEGES